MMSAETRVTIRRMFGTALFGLLCLLQVPGCGGGSGGGGGGAAPGVEVAPGTASLSENGGVQDFQVRLQTAPNGTVVMKIVCRDDAKAWVEPQQLSFNSENWATPQRIWVYGKDDRVADGNRLVEFALGCDGAASGDTTGYLQTSKSFSVTVTDDDKAGVTVTHDPLIFPEGGGSGTFTVGLNTRPNGNVVIDVTSTDATEAVVDQPRLTFTADNWAVPRTLTVYGVDDSDFDDSQSVRVAVDVNPDPALTTDTTGYALLKPSEVADVLVTVVDDDSVGLTVVPGRTSFSEQGGTGYFNVVLTSKPLQAGNETGSKVVIDLTSHDPGEARVQPGQLTFDADDWWKPQLVELIGVNDDVADANQSIDISVEVNAALTIDGTGYQALAQRMVKVTVMDDDEAGFTLSAPALPLTVSEAGTSQDFAVVLNSEPTGAVVFDIASADREEATVSPSRLTFAAGNWSNPQSVRVTGQDDDIDDDTQRFNITVAVDPAATADDSGYPQLPSQFIPVQVEDDDTADLTLIGELLSLSESGTTDSFKVGLTSEPDARVVVRITSPDDSEAKVNKPTLTFTPGDWQTAQEVTVTGVDDDLADGNQSFELSVTVDGAETLDTTGYKSVLPKKIAVIVADDDSANITVTATRLSVSEAAPDNTASFAVGLTSQPDGVVVIRIASDDPTKATVNSPLNFTPENWRSAQTVQVAGQNDDLAGGNQTFDLTVAVDREATQDTTGYKTQPAQVVELTVEDDDRAQVTLSATALTISEAAADNVGSFLVGLSSQPSGEVVITLTSRDPSQATVDSPLRFTPGNWKVKQPATLRAVNDALADGNQSVEIIVAVDASATLDQTGYPDLPAQSLTLTVEDDDQAQITLSRGSLTISEAAPNDTGSFEVNLSSQPDGDVVINLLSGDASEATVNSPLRFTPGNWSVAQRVSVEAVDDEMADGNRTFDITLAVDVDATQDSTGYGQLAAQSVSVTVEDDDLAQIALDKQSLTLTEAAPGNTASFKVSLSSQPDGDVVIALTSGKPGEATVASPLTFTSANWKSAQPVSVQAVNDALADGNQSFDITLAVDDTASGDTTGYKDLPALTLPVTVEDDDQAQITLSGGPLVVSETGTVDSFEVKLSSQPSANVVIGFTSGRPAEAEVLDRQLIFTPDSWDDFKTVRVKGLDDPVADGNQGFDIVVAVDVAATLDETGYADLEPQTLGITVQDDDVAGVTVGTRDGNPIVLGHAGSTGTITVVLNTRPDGEVLIDLSNPDPSITLSSEQVVFAPAEWSTVQNVVVTRVAEQVVGADQIITLSLAVNLDGTNDTTGYRSLVATGDVPDVTVTLQNLPPPPPPPAE
ncbi:hypothetical protein DESUT3_03650 [Desulfuromonas versatilis]|uniref:Calx-beta domain-containing protein n=1 Tax=Desulfuromonas versatilis TaxID=2802975 RepID=A0ABN6DVW7_9BACT|nr:Calx-beta domain-containing protein [Desulfuromonas versatilis]BCR03296.1 hypothetical protein DESUT3_03650 [Desulfuromonas versatilis]